MTIAPMYDARADAPGWTIPTLVGSCAVAKLSVSLPDDLVHDLKEAAGGNVSSFVTAAVRNELDRRRLHAFVDELADELGPLDEAEVARYNEMFASSAATPAGESQ